MKSTKIHGRAKENKSSKGHFSSPHKVTCWVPYTILTTREDCRRMYPPQRCQHKQINRERREYGRQFRRMRTLMMRKWRNWSYQNLEPRVSGSPSYCHLSFPCPPCFLSSMWFLYALYSLRAVPSNRKIGWGEGEIKKIVNCRGAREHREEKQHGRSVEI